MAADPELPPPGERLRGLLVGLCCQARADLRRMRRHPGPAVHALRVRMKKLGAALRLVAPGLAASDLASLRCEARVIRQAFSVSRDAEVAHRLVLRLADASGLPVPVLRLAPPAALPLPSRERVRRRLIRLEQRLAGLPLATLTTIQLREVWWRQYRRCRRLKRRCQHKPRSEPLHLWRKRVKELQHLGLALVVLRLDLPVVRQRLQAVRELGRRLGRVQDLAVLAAALPKEAGRDWQRLLAERRRRLLRQVFASAGRCLKTPARKLLHDLAHD